MTDQVAGAEFDSVSKSSSKSSRSRSSTSSRSSYSHVSRKSTDALAEVAALTSKLKYIDKEAKCKAELKRLKTLMKLDMAQAKLEALESSQTTGEKRELPRFGVTADHRVRDFLISQTVTQTPAVENAIGLSLNGSVLFEDGAAVDEIQETEITHYPENALLNTNAPPFVPCQPIQPAVEKDSQTALTNLIKSLTEQVSLGRLPPPEPNIFYGDPMKYPSWKVAFQALIEHRGIPPSERIHYLKRYIGGQVRETVESYFLLPPEDAFEEAKALLEERYGNSFVIANAFRDKLENWEKISPRDGAALQKYADFLRQCDTAMKSIGSLGVLNDERENKKMLFKLPDWTITRWAIIVAQWRENKGEFPPFTQFVEFIKKQAKIATDPITSLQAIKAVEGTRLTRHNRSQPKYNREGQTFATINVNTFNRKETCVLCQGTHDLDTCPVFKAKTLADKKLFARERRLCFGCLKYGHISRECRQRKKCAVCTKPHPTSLHGDIKPQGNSRDEKENNPIASTSGTTLMNHTESLRKTSMILPVYVSQEDNPNAERLVYAILDSQSDTTFILSNTCESLGIVGKPVKLRLSTMHAENKIIDSSKVQGLLVRGFYSRHRIKLPGTYTRNIMPANRSHIPTPEVAELWPHLKGIAHRISPLQDCEVGLLIGYNCTKALTPREIIAPADNGPYGQRTDLGWGIVGIADGIPEYMEDDQVGVSHRIMVKDVSRELTAFSDGRPDGAMFSVRNTIKEVINPNELIKMFELDFNENHGRSKALSEDDRKFLSILEEGIELKNGRYEMPLPFRNDTPNLPNNRELALRRLHHLKKRFLKDPSYHNQYDNFIKNLISKGHAERVTTEDGKSGNNHVWYLPHHGVYHPRKPNKLRVVFDGSARYMSQSLNDHLLPGPDFINSLCGVLCRFRKEQVAFVCDIEQMFLQFQVDTHHRNYLRFLWWENGDVNREPCAYRMTRHLFGTVSSPGCANFALRKAATDGETEFGTDVANFIKREFYVDDGLKSVATPDTAVSIIKRSIALCKKNGLVLHKFMSNSKEVLKKIAPEARAKGLERFNFNKDSLPIERTLGIQWCIESDTFRFRITLSNKPLTRRGVLSTLSSVYDPLGFVAPFILIGKQILQEMCMDQLDWDSPVPERLRPRWQQWIMEVKNLDAVIINRCLKPANLGKVVATEIHHFSDASTTGYGQCSYLRLINCNQRVHCVLIMAKSRVTPIKPVTIPRLELTAALVSVKVSSMLLEELDIPNITEWFWTDSTVVLGYIRNDSRRFHVFVANRVQQIRDHTEPYQWNYICSANNPADIASRGATPNELMSKGMWFNGPDFLWKSNTPFIPDKNRDQSSCINDNDPEIKKSHVFNTATRPISQNSIVDRLQHFSNWLRAVRVVALCLKYKARLRARTSSEKSSAARGAMPTVSDLETAKIEILRQLQMNTFDQELQDLNKADEKNDKRKHAKQLRCTSPLYRLDPFLDKDGLIRVGGRLNKGNFGESVKHPIILPRKSHITELLISHFHQKVKHQGRTMTTNEIRQGGFWIIGCSSAVYTFVSKCVTCRKNRGQTQIQKMSDLPADRIEPEPPFTYSGVDFFGPFLIKDGRKELKRYGVLFTCMSSRAIHLETATSLDTSSFINALRRFVSIRGTVRQLRSDRGTNFIGASHELRDALKEMDNSHLQHYLSDLGCDYITFKTNPPTASHMGGSWERQIRTVRNILSSLMHDFGTSLDDESLRTFLCETMAIINCRPLTVDGLNDPLNVEPLTPNHLLTMKSKIVLPPPGKFQRADLYCRKRWRRVQYLANEFWTRWKREFIQTLQERKKWCKPKRNMTAGDVVLIKDDNSPRNQWQMGRITESILSADGLVRAARVAVGNRNLPGNGKPSKPLQILERPIHKLILLNEAETEEVPTEEP